MNVSQSNYTNSFIFFDSNRSEVDPAWPEAEDNLDAAYPSNPATPGYLFDSETFHLQPILPEQASLQLSFSEMNQQASSDFEILTSHKPFERENVRYYTLLTSSPAFDSSSALKKPPVVVSRTFPKKASLDSFFDNTTEQPSTNVQTLPTVNPPEKETAIPKRGRPRNKLSPEERELRAKLRHKLSAKRSRDKVKLNAERFEQIFDKVKRIVKSHPSVFPNLLEAEDDPNLIEKALLTSLEKIDEKTQTINRLNFLLDIKENS